MASIYMNSRVLHRLDAEKGHIVEKERPERWETIFEARLVELEDSFQALFTGSDEYLEFILAGSNESPDLEPLEGIGGL